MSVAQARDIVWIATVVTVWCLDLVTAVLLVENFPDNVVRELHGREKNHSKSMTRAKINLLFFRRPPLASHQDWQQMRQKALCLLLFLRH